MLFHPLALRRAAAALSLLAAGSVSSACGSETDLGGPTDDPGAALSPSGRAADPGEEQAAPDDAASDPLTGLGAGNGAPSGSHYNLNVIGVPKDKTADMTGSSGHRIFVPLVGKTKIELREGDFQVLDGNGTDGVAQFQLPASDPDGDGVTEYSVWARALGTPGGSSTTTTCATDPTTGEEVCSTESLVAVRSTGKSRFTDVSRDLLFVYVDLDGDGVTERYGLFDDALVDYFWSYDNDGLKLLQLRFYPVASSAGL